MSAFPGRFPVLLLMRNSGLGIFVSFSTGMITLDYQVLMMILAALAVVFAVLLLKILKWKKTDNISE
ncbi:MAG: hypothetical protein IJE57_01210 [Anaerotignum sp.]|nr:hypothetical protein [Anaerotignum sp.]